MASVSGRLTAAGRSFRLKPVFKALRAKRKKTLAVKLSRKARRAAAAALARNKSVSARITLSGGPGSRKTLSVKLR